MNRMGVDAGEFRSVLGHFASGVVLITGMSEGEPAGLTCQSFFSLSLDPPLVAVAPGKNSTSWPKVSSSGSICMNILSDEQEPLAWTFAQTGADKFAGVGWVPAAHGAPRLHDALAWVDGVIEDVFDTGDHWLVTVRVVDLESRPGRPLLFYRGGFGGFAP